MKRIRDAWAVLRGRSIATPKEAWWRLYEVAGPTPDDVSFSAYGVVELKKAVRDVVNPRATKENNRGD